jgi:hypothetical protein
MVALASRRAVEAQARRLSSAARTWMFRAYVGTMLGNAGDDMQHSELIDHAWGKAVNKSRVCVSQLAGLRAAGCRGSNAAS